MRLTSAKVYRMPVQEVKRGTWDPSPANANMGSLNSPTVNATASCRTKVKILSDHYTGVGYLAPSGVTG